MNIEAWTLRCGDEVVRGDGRGMYWLGSGGHPMKKMPGNSYTEKHRVRIEGLATKQVGHPCQWVQDGTVEVMACM